VVSRNFSTNSRFDFPNAITKIATAQRRLNQYACTSVFYNFLRAPHVVAAGANFKICSDTGTLVPMAFNDQLKTTLLLSGVYFYEHLYFTKHGSIIYMKKRKRLN